MASLLNPEDSGDIGDITHDYALVGIYTVDTRGTFPRIYFNRGGNKESILTIEKWDTNSLSSMEDAFYGCKNLNITIPAICVPDLSSVLSMKIMFDTCNNFNFDNGNVDVSTLKILIECFIPLQFSSAMYLVKSGTNNSVKTIKLIKR